MDAAVLLLLSHTSCILDNAKVGSSSTSSSGVSLHNWLDKESLSNEEINKFGQTDRVHESDFQRWRGRCTIY